VEQAHARPQGPAQPSPTLGDAINTGYLEVKRLAGKLRSTSSGDRSQRRSMNSNATCDARIARRFAAIPIVFVSNLAFPPDVPTHFQGSWLG
jgi:hypothetical protein